MSAPPFNKTPKRVRQRLRRNGWVIWWEPEKAVRELGFERVDLDANKPTWSKRQADTLNSLVDQARKGTKSDTAPNRAAQPARRSVAALIADYKASSKWQNLRPNTQRDYANGFKQIEGKWGDQPVSIFDTPVIWRWYETLYSTSGKYQASRLIRHFSILFKHARQCGWRSDNPCLQLGIKSPAPRQRLGSWEDLDQLIAAAHRVGDPRMACAIALSAFVGQRQKDICDARTEDFHDGHWRFVRSKRGTAAALELSAEVLEIVHHTKALDPDRTYLIGLTDAPAELYAFQRRWKKVRAAAIQRRPSLEGFQFRDLRRTFATMARRTASERDVADALGNSSYKDPRLSGTYMVPESETAARAIQAIQRPKKTETG